MEIVVLLKQVPDLVEELEIAATGRTIDRERSRFVVSELDSHALEEAVLLKERHGGTVVVLSLDIGEAREALLRAIAHGADRALLLRGEFPEDMDNHQAAQALAGALKEMKYDLVLTGAQAIDDVDGQVGGLVAGYLGLPYVSVVSRVEVAGGQQTATVAKELAGGTQMRLEVTLPAVLGIQAAEQPPRYIPMSRLRQVMRTVAVEMREAPQTRGGGVTVRRLFKPEPVRRAEILPGSPDEVAQAIVKLLQDRGLLR